MRTLRFLAPLALVVVLVAACGGGSTKVPSGAVAVVGKDKVERTEFEGLITQAKRTYKSQKRTFPKAGSAEYQALQTQAVEFLVQRQEFAQKAKDLGIVNDVWDAKPADFMTKIHEYARKFCPPNNACTGPSACAGWD